MAIPNRIAPNVKARPTTNKTNPSGPPNNGPAGSRNALAVGSAASTGTTKASSPNTKMKQAVLPNVSR